MPSEIRFRTPREFKEDVLNMKEKLKLELSKDNFYFVIFELGFSQLQRELLKGSILKIEFLPSKQTKKLVFEKEIERGYKK